MLPKITTRTDRDDVRPTPERARHDELVQTETTVAGVFVHQVAETREPPLIDRLHERRYVTAEQHGLLEHYAHLLRIGCAERSPPGSRWGGVAGDSSDLAEEAAAEVRLIDAWVAARAGNAASRCLRAACDSHLGEKGLHLPAKGLPYWMALLRRAMGALETYRPEDAREWRKAKII